MLSDLAESGIKPREVDTSPAASEQEQNDSISELKSWKQAQITGNYPSLFSQDNEATSGTRKRSSTQPITTKKREKIKLRSWKRAQVEQKYPSDDLYIPVKYKLLLDDISDKGKGEIFYRAVDVYLTLQDTNQEALEKYFNYIVVTLKFSADMKIIQEMVSRGVLAAKQAVVEKFKMILEDFINPIYWKYQKDHKVTEQEHQKLVNSFRRLIYDTIYGDYERKDIPIGYDKLPDLFKVPLFAEKQYKKSIKDLNNLIVRFKEKKKAFDEYVKKEKKKILGGEFPYDFYIAQAGMANAFISSLTGKFVDYENNEPFRKNFNERFENIIVDVMNNIIRTLDKEKSSFLRELRYHAGAEDELFFKADANLTELLKELVTAVLITNEYHEFADTAELDKLEELEIAEAKVQEYKLKFALDTAEFTGAIQSCLSDWVKSAKEQWDLVEKHEVCPTNSEQNELEMLSPRSRYLGPG